MIPGNLGQDAQLRRAELLRQAELARLARAANPPRPHPAAARLGDLLIRLGWRLKGSVAPPARPHPLDSASPDYYDATRYIVIGTVRRDAALDAPGCWLPGGASPARGLAPGPCEALPGRNPWTRSAFSN